MRGMLHVACCIFGFFNLRNLKLILYIYIYNIKYYYYKNYFSFPFPTLAKNEKCNMQHATIAVSAVNTAEAAIFMAERRVG